LAGYANGRDAFDGAGVREDSLPPAGSRVSVSGVPFVFPGVNAEGQDHLDISRSLLRQANAYGYQPTTGLPGRFSGAARRDPARIQLRVPNGQYDALYVVAAAEDKRDTVPLISAMFYRPDAGFAETFESRVPFATSDSAGAQRLPVTLSSGKRVN